jgi:glycine C-acetyltransferase
VLGERGHGIYEHYGLPMDDDVVVGTLSKGLGCVGGFVAGKRDVINLLRAVATPYAFSASLTPAVVAAAIEGLRILEESDELVRQLRCNVKAARAALQEFGVDADSASPIISLRLPQGMSAKTAVGLAERAGVFLNGIGYPAVPAGMDMLRVNISAGHVDADLQPLVEALGSIFEAAPQVRQEVAP